ncbi:hypothetical protein [Lacticaseibacillus hulanensis]|uniref:hypothetical protein n=1 Tax=Lacticaseibacillus hulanensis TaxID=2493111 RepID=UPI000FD77742|nr:hypothetical protein [Lacticaseibacillus hulanensis]
MLKNETIERLATYQTLTVESHKLANCLHVKDADAMADLLTELMTHRLKDYDDDQVTQAIASDDMAFSFKIIYSRRDMLRKHFREKKRKLQAQRQLESSGYVDTIRLESGTRTPDDVDQAVEMIPHLFASKKTQEFTRLVLEHGKAHTMKLMGLTDKQFRTKLVAAEKYCTRHREKIWGLIQTRKDEELMSEMNCLIELDHLLAQKSYTDVSTQIWIDQYRNYAEDLVGELPGISNQSMLLNDFPHAPLHDRYRLVNEVADRLTSIEHRIVRM